MENLTQLIERYGTLKGEMDSYKKQVDADNKAIKEIMAENNLTEASGGGYIAKYSESVSNNFDEAKLLEKLENMTYKDPNCSCPVSVKSLGVIKMKPYVDMEALENAIYNGQISAVDLADCRIVVKTPRLTIKKEK